MAELELHVCIRLRVLIAARLMSAGVHVVRGSIGMTGEQLDAQYKLA